MKNVQVPEQYVYAVKCLLSTLADVDVKASDIDARVIQRCIEILQRATDAKIEAMEKRQAFTEYKTAERGSVERERARERYAELAGIPDGFKSTREIQV